MNIINFILGIVGLYVFFKLWRKIHFDFSEVTPVSIRIGSSLLAAGAIGAAFAPRISVMIMVLGECLILSSDRRVRKNEHR